MTEEIITEIAEEVVPILGDIVSRDMKSEQIRHRMDIEDRELDMQLKTCTGLTTDKRLITLITSTLISLMVISFSCYQLAANKLDCSTQHTYVGLLTLIIGIWLKSPV